MADDDNDTSTDDDNGDEKGSDGIDAGEGRGAEVGGGTVEEKEVNEDTKDEQAPLSGALPGPVDPPGSSTQD
ncbi:MAG: hypothetical protein ACR2LJ_05390 [Acidimicrobiales bacterium]